MAETVRALVERGIPVIGHLGLTPQSVHALGGYRVQGRDDGAAERLLADAQGARGGRGLRHRAGAAARGAGARGSRRRSPSRPSASAPAPAATARCWCCTTCSASTRSSTPSSSSATPELGEAVRAAVRGLRRRGARRQLSRARSTASIDSCRRHRVSCSSSRPSPTCAGGCAPSAPPAAASARAHDGLSARGPPPPGGRGPAARRARSS